MRIAILGGGGWGLALSALLSENGHQVLVWEFNPVYITLLKETHSNPHLLPEITIPGEVDFSNDFKDIVIFSPEIVILATPSQFLRTTLQNTPDSLWHSPSLKAIVNVAKGIEEDSLKTLDIVIKDELPFFPENKICALSGPSHAEEVARKIPTTVVIAGSDEDLLCQLQIVFSNSYFRVYRNSDLVGVEIGGAVKNIISIAAGIIYGLNFGDNTIGALLTRGIVEIQRLGITLSARPETFLGLSGLGDLITTATSPHSRNRYVGMEIGKGKKLFDIISQMEMVAEGVTTTRSVYLLAKKMQVEMPIVEKVYQVLYEDEDPRKAIVELMTRELKAE
ncbi:MAG TPA: NAD(P)H-dependent glycerol-3-phosphate dehydrogenase [Candidatus Cloacimonas sp.]|jgi:glycerol-3-phosphate dehydrogenase (NAD(P)+)|nr:NAD(P)-dependent glycerol-3-phosphate dehydrogenase [Candidatus Cloacimonas sp.]MDD2249531.1 NAD(P)-dependent glycerol-3-phosphate dehydrogenase [Candidatus Cloacimonadota bacterium]MCK9157205.1 NAD(P)-dependent glycerol-3-phosphate dehydrogenase [Candidatus Cloacimonas sp.]MCK9164526.1 NAD(P)-dependent glycerol-3-phosphate dehydrogenase [Candidatus Cloacimonas sp.]MDD3733371.1 NAD(P)-dependent glycerol-3-phosphate dehydrogenase [Candidatus Cloacimonadota bacterium]